MRIILNIIRFFIAGLVAIIFLGILVIFTFGNITRNLLQEGAIASYLSKNDLKDWPLEKLYGDNESEFSDKESQINFYLRDYLKSENMSSETIDLILENKNINKVIGLYFEKLILYELKINGSINLDSNEVIELLEENTISEGDKSIIRNVIAELNENNTVERITFDSKILEVINMINNKYFIIEAIGIIIFIYFLLALLCWSFYKPLAFIAIPTLLLSIPLTLIKNLFNFIITFFGFSNDYIDIILKAINPLFKTIKLYGFIYFVITIILIIIYTTVNKKKTRMETASILEAKLNTKVETNNIKKNICNQ